MGLWLFDSSEFHVAVSTPNVMSQTQFFNFLCLYASSPQADSDYESLKIPYIFLFIKSIFLISLINSLCLIWLCVICIMKQNPNIQNDTSFYFSQIK